MNIELFQVDAFTNKLFSGNPAAICKLDAWLPDNLLQAIALENHLSETAFIVPNNGEYLIRWFTPASEIQLCGHATLAAGFVIFHYLEPERENVVFNSPSGHLHVSRDNDYIALNFPSTPGTECPTPSHLSKAFDIEPIECYASIDYMAVFETENQIKNINLDIRELQQLDRRGVIITAPSKNYDFVSRYFAPELDILEDPVTGSAHCTLTPYWAKRLGKTKLLAKQISHRGGELICEYQHERIVIKGHVIPYMRGSINVGAIES